jgi:hypothetical protein
MATKKRSTAKPKTAESRSKELAKVANTLLKIYGYAHFDDIGRNWEGPEEYSDLLFQSYENVIRNKDDQKAGLKERLSFGSDTASRIAFMFERMLVELNSIGIVATDDIDRIAKKLTESASESYAVYMFKTVFRFRDLIGTTLQAAKDPLNIFESQITNGVKSLQSLPVVRALIAVEFDRYLRVVALYFGNHCWYHEATVHEAHFLGFLATTGMAQSMIDELRSPITEKKRGGKKKAVTGAVTAAGTEAANAATPVATDTTATDTTNTEAKANPIDAGDLSDLLNDM